MKGLRSVFLGFLAAVIVSAGVHAEPVQRIHEIQQPLFNIPALVKAGETFELKLKLGEGKSASEATLIGATDPSLKVALDLGAPESSEDLSVFHVRVPADAPEALYDLSVTFSDGASDTQRHSVKVVKEFKDKFDFIHITDIHFNDQPVAGQDMNRIRTRLLQDISKYNPEFVIFSGDLGLNPDTYDVDYVYGYEQFVSLLKAPVFMIPGNHELYIDHRVSPPIDGMKYWEATYGPLWNSFDYGNLHVIGLCSSDWEPELRERFNPDLAIMGVIVDTQIRPKQWEWIKSDLAQAKSRGGNIIAYMHIPIDSMLGGRMLINLKPPRKVQGPTQKEFTDVLNSFGVSHIFVGHMHFNRILQYGNLTEVMTLAAGIGAAPPWGFRIVHVENGKITGWDLHEIRFEDLK